MDLLGGTGPQGRGLALRWAGELHEHAELAMVALRPEAIAGADNQGCAEQAARLLPDSGVTAAFHDVSAVTLVDLSTPRGEDPAATALRVLAGMDPHAQGSAGESRRWCSIND